MLRAVSSASASWVRNQRAAQKGNISQQAHIKNEALGQTQSGRAEQAAGVPASAVLHTSSAVSPSAASCGTSGG